MLRPVLLAFALVLGGHLSGSDAPAAGAPGAAIPNGPDAIIGSWVSSDGKAHITISKGADHAYGGAISWLKDPNDEHGHPRVDTENPDKGKRTQAILGLQILSGLKGSGERAWEGGAIYDPESGSSYHCRASMSADRSSLDLRGYVGISLFGRTETWKRLASGP